jgi:hypothetical protein
MADNCMLLAGDNAPQIPAHACGAAENVQSDIRVSLRMHLASPATRSTVKCAIGLMCCCFSWNHATSRHNSEASACPPMVPNCEICRRGRTPPACSNWDAGWPDALEHGLSGNELYCELLLEAMVTRIIIRHATVTSGRMPYREILTPAKLRALVAFINHNLITAAIRRSGRGRGSQPGSFGAFVPQRYRHCIAGSNARGPCCPRLVRGSTLSLRSAALPTHRI